MSELGLTIRCQRCGDPMELRDPADPADWKPDQFWVCQRCGRHYWTTYTAPPGQKPKPAATPAPAQAPES
jgi:hypothetical protein